MIFEGQQTSLLSSKINIHEIVSKQEHVDRTHSRSLLYLPGHFLTTTTNSFAALNF